MNISEIGLVTTDIEKEYNILDHGCEIDIYSGEFDRFCSLGDQNGLFICIDKTLKKHWFPTMNKPYSSDFLVKIKKDQSMYLIQYLNETLTIDLST